MGPLRVYILAGNLHKSTQFQLSLPSQDDGQTKVANQSPENLFRCFAIEQPKTWLRDKDLP